MNGSSITYSQLAKKFFLYKRNTNISSGLQGRLSIELCTLVRKQHYTDMQMSPAMSADNVTVPYELTLVGDDRIGFLVTTDLLGRADRALVLVVAHPDAPPTDIM